MPPIFFTAVALRAGLKVPLEVVQSWAQTATFLFVLINVFIYSKQSKLENIPKKKKDKIKSYQRNNFCVEINNILILTTFFSTIL